MFQKNIHSAAHISRKLALAYFILSTIWIIGTDLAFSRSAQEESLQTGKGLIFVSVTAVIIYFAARYYISMAMRAERTLRFIYERSQVSIVLVSLDGNIVDCNTAFTNFLCCPKAELIGTHFREWIDSEQINEADKLFNLLVTKGTSYRTERRYIRRDGQEVWGMVSASLIEIDKKAPTSVVLMIEDITEAKRSHEALTRSEARLRRFVQSDVIGIMFFGLDGTIKEANNAFLGMIGYSLDEIARIDWTEITPPEFRAASKDAAQQLRDHGVFRSFEEEYIRKDGTRVPVLIGGALFEGGSEEGVAFVLDLSSLRDAQREVVRLARIIETTDDAVVSLALAGDVLTWNRGAERLYGYKAAEIIGKAFSTLFPPDHLEDANSILEAVRRGRTLDHFETVLLTHSGDAKPVSLTASPMRDTTGKLIGSSTTARDLTAHKHAQDLEKQFRQAQKLESLGRLAGGIAHDFNNILTVIGSYAQLAQYELPPDHALQNYMEQISKATEKAAGLTRQMLAFSRKQVLAPKIINLNDVIEDTVGMVKRLIGEPIRVAFRPADQLWAISADPDQMTQVLLNLCVNARDAMPDGGRLTIETRNIEITADSKQADLAPGQYISLTVSDTGIGMSREVQERIFEPFFTTKEVGKGTGLGLATVYGIVKQSGGAIAVTSEPGHGSRFDLYFPRVGESATVGDESAKSDGRGNETLLVVEDEAALRECMCHFLKQNGYNVLNAGSGEEATEVARSFNGIIDLLITDVVMPRMSGRELSEILTNARPGLRTLLMSGYTDEVIEPEMLSATLRFVQKPFSLTELGQIVREILEQQR